MRICFRYFLRHPKFLTDGRRNRFLQAPKASWKLLYSSSAIVHEWNFFCKDLEQTLQPVCQNNSTTHSLLFNDIIYVSKFEQLISYKEECMSGRKDNKKAVVQSNTGKGAIKNTEDNCLVNIRLCDWKWQMQNWNTKSI